jgi:chromosome segregation ATPase
LTTADERVVLQKLDRLDAQLKNREKASNKTRQRIARLKGVITWNIHTQYQERFTKATEHLHELDKHVKKLKEIYNEFVRTRQAATQSYKGYDKQLQRLRIKIRQAQEKVQVLMARQGHMIEVMAINELELRRKRLEEYQVKARFAMAESYDRATKKKQEQQIEKDREKLQQEQQQQSTTEKEAKPRQTEKQQEDVANSSSDQPNPQPASSAK